MFFKSNSSAEYLIVGLGNPEKKYDGSRHNVGFEAVDFCAEKWGIQINKSKFNALYGQGEVKGVKIILQKPLTYMNNSGDAVGAAAQFFKIPAAKVIILNDDISLAPGRVRMREKGSAGGHNGLKSIISRLGEDFIRIKIGVGEKPNPEYDLAAWVLGKLPPSDVTAIKGKFDDICTGIECIIEGDDKKAINICNRQSEN